MILEHGGLQKGDVIIGEQGEQTLTATWLTTDPDPTRCRGVTTGGLAVLPAELAARSSGSRWRETINKRVVRITVKIPSTDRELKHWVVWAKGRVGQALYDFEIEFSGGKVNVANYYFYRPLIPKDDFVSIELFHEGDGKFHRATDEQLAALRAHEIGQVWSMAEAPRDN
ncbi:hypothetical protein [Methylobacterium oryzae]|uniref:Uncharacterized protein n=1 Tax=Methylobacterium oryzae TaxID=334852 RepID=A0ABU7TUW8_9HYPH